METIELISEDVSPQNKEFQKLLLDLEKKMAIKIDGRTSKETLQIYGLEEDVKEAKSIIEQYLKSLCIKTERFIPNLTPDVWTFFELRFDKLKEVKEEFKNMEGSVILEKLPFGKHQFSITGNVKDVSACKGILEKVLFGEIKEKDEKIVYPGLKKLFEGNKGKNWVIGIEEKWNVSIHVKIQPTVQPLSSHPQRFATVSYSGHAQNVFPRYNFTTMEGLKLSCKIGRIENEKVCIMRKILKSLFPSHF